MIKIEIKKEELEKFFKNFKGEKENTYKKWYTIQLIKFNDFKELFCSNEINFSKINKNKVNNYKKIYDNISSKWKSKIYIEIRKFIIEKFTEKIKFCPYCWKVPLIFFEKWQNKDNSYKRMFQFDHFFPKNHFHKWIINFYNLIPNCNACNHLKWEDNPLNIINDWWVIFHPYFWNLYLEKWEIKKDCEENIDWRNYDIWLNYISKNSKFFKLGQKYLNSQDTFNIFNFIQDKRTKIKDERLKFKENSKSDEELKNYFFKNYYPTQEQDILKFSNWKLKKDLIENLEIKLQKKWYLLGD